MAFQRLRAGFGQRETDQLACLRLRFEDVHGAASDEKWLGATDRPAHVDLGRMGHAVRVLTDDHVAFFKPQQTLGFHPKRADVECFAGFHQRIPQLQRMPRRNVNFIAKFAYETDPQ
ncbi:hypothetical protein D3C86_1776270 [compost metagenome]